MVRYGFGWFDGKDEWTVPVPDDYMPGSHLRGKYGLVYVVTAVTPSYEVTDHRCTSIHPWAYHLRTLSMPFTPGDKRDGSGGYTAGWVIPGYTLRVQAADLPDKQTERIRRSIRQGNVVGSTFTNSLS